MTSEYAAGIGAAVLDLKAAVAAEILNRNLDQKDWVDLTILEVKRGVSSEIFIRAEDVEEVLREGQGVRIRCNQTEFSAEIVGLRPGDMTLLVKDCNLTDISSAQFRQKTYDSLETLNKFFEDVLGDSRHRVWCNDSSVLATSITEPWDKRSLRDHSRYIIGAPGSGKTTALVERAIEIARSGQRVAIVTFTNAAADVIFSRIAPWVMTSGRVTATRHGLTSAAMKVVREANCSRIDVSRVQREALEADIMVTTSYRSMYLAQRTQSSHAFVLFDEASTLPLALAWPASLLADQGVEFYGDPFQLGPVASDDLEAVSPREAFKTSPFEVEGVLNPTTTDSPVRVLRAQHRLSANLAAAATPPIYRSEGLQAPAPESEPESPWGKGSLLFIDTSDLAPVGERVNKSRRNKVHAHVVRECVREFLEQGVVEPAYLSEYLLIISPYRAQRGAIRAVLTESGWLSQEQIRATVTTIHRAQGSERPYVILDITDAPMSEVSEDSPIGRLWDGRGWQSDGARLLTTALTRASVQALVIMRRDIVGVPDDFLSPAIKALPRLNAMLNRYGHRSSSGGLPRS